MAGRKANPFTSVFNSLRTAPDAVLKVGKKTVGKDAEDNKILAGYHYPVVSSVSSLDANFVLYCVNLVVKSFFRAQPTVADAREKMRAELVAFGVFTPEQISAAIEQKFADLSDPEIPAETDSDDSEDSE